jgi:hypothetical protein
MMRRAKKIRNGILLGLLCAGCVAAYLLITAHESPAAKGVLYNPGNDPISRVHIENRYGSFDFYEQDGAWVVESGGIYRTNPQKIRLLLASLEQFKIIRMLADEKSEYGFESPQAIVRVETKGKGGFGFVVGDEAISGSSVYIKSDGKVMLTSSSMTAQLTGSLAAYRAKDVLEVIPAEIRSIEYYINGERTLLLANESYQSWRMKVPFHAPARNVVMNELIAKLRTLTIAGYVDLATDDKEFGLDFPAASMVLTDQNGVTQQLDFGAVADTLQYVRIGEEHDIVKLYAKDLSFSALTPAGVMYIAPLDIPIDLVQSVLIRVGDETDTLTLERDSSVGTAFLNGTNIPYSEAFVSIYFKCITLNADGYDTDPSQPGTCEAVITTTLIDERTVSLSLYRRDESTLYLYVDGKPIQDGQTMFYLEEDVLHELLYRLNKAKGG